MSNSVIRVENLSKRYTLQHQHEKRQHKLLREVAIDQAKLLGQRLTGRRLALSNEQEEFWALRDVSFEIKQGDRIGIIGRNGAGKSTLLKILSRIVEPSAGQVAVRGRVASLLEVGTGFHPELTGRENVFLNGAILGMSRAEIARKFDEIIAFAEVEKFLDTPVKRYSSGMYVRLAFAVAAHLEPEILIVDEVLAVGDTQFQKKCLGKIDSVSQEGRTVLFVSHSIGALRSLCNRAIWLKQGQLHRQGSALAITDEYLSSMLQSSTHQTNLAEIHRSHPPETLKLTQLSVNHGDPVLHGEPVSLTMEYEMLRAASGVAFEVGFRTIEGTRLLSIDSDIPGPLYDLTAGTKGSITVHLEPLLLEPGRYLIDVGARYGGGEELEYLEGCMQVEVLPGPQTPGVILGTNGGVRIPAKWECLQNIAPKAIPMLLGAAKFNN
jgi:lipopolysaccharide transport system ATP-binding protein